MRFSTISISGYGRFSDEDLELSPGLQVIAGPNERGKSTLRHYISDVLYGQKRSSTRRLYEESNELRVPWASANGYGGRLVYTLDSGHCFEIERSFDRKNDFVRVFDRTDARDVTHEFPVLKNRESLFAEQHLNMTKSVFLGIATISHVSLSDLGDQHALVSIREKLLSLADSGGEDSSAEQAQAWLRDRIAAIGQPTARTKPLPVTRQRLTDLQAEYQQVHEAAKEIEVYEKQRAGVLEQIGSMIYRRSSLEKELELRETVERATLLRKGEALELRINSIAEECESLAGARDFPLDALADAQRAATVAETAKQQVARTQEELSGLNSEFDEAADRLQAEGILVMKEADLDAETRLAELDKEIGRVNEHLRSVVQSRDRAVAGEQGSKSSLGVAPDFSQCGPDPVQHFSELANAFSVARHARDEEQNRLERLRATAAELQERGPELRALFDEHEEFLIDLRAYEAERREQSIVSPAIEQERILLKQQAEDLADKIPGFTIGAVASAALGGVMPLVVQLTQNASLYLPAAFFGAMFVFCLISAFWTRQTLRKTRDRLVEVDEEETAAQSKQEQGHGVIKSLMKEGDCATTRELEALYDRYQQDLADEAALERQIGEQGAIVETTEEELRKRREEVTAEFADVGVTVEDDDVVAASARVLTSYQEYRDAKRLSGEFSEAVKRFDSEVLRTEERLEALKTEELEVSLEVRAFLRDNHYEEEKNFDSALKALKQYRIRSAQQRKDQGEIDVAQGQVKIVRKQMEVDQAELATQEGALAELLEGVGVESLEAFEEKAEQARRYGELTRERAGLEEQLSALLGDVDLEALRASVAEEEDVSAGPTSSTNELQDEINAITTELDAKRKQEHALHLMMTERTAGQRTLNEVDEERAATGQRMSELELELQAAAYATSVIEEVTRQQHSRIAPQLAKRASGYLKEITNGVYKELLVDRDMQISVRIPQTNALNPDPARRLSKGTVDQIYFALRLAMVQSMSHNSESIPMVLDDPFSNYDDERLACAMQLLAKMGETNQVLLFTCRQDVMRAAEAVNAPILQI